MTGGRDMNTPLRSTQPTTDKDLEEIIRKDINPTISPAANIIITIFSDREGVLLVDFLPRGTIINDPYYSILLHRLRSSIREKWNGKLRHGVLLLQDNAPVHKSNIAQASPN